MIAIGVGGADAVDVMTGMEWELKNAPPHRRAPERKPERMGCPQRRDTETCRHPYRKRSDQCHHRIFRRRDRIDFGNGESTICNMGAEVGATTSIFPYDEQMATYLCATGREEIARLASACADCLQADPEVLAQPEKYYDRIIEIDLSALEPYINGPFTPDAACPISDFAEKVKANGYPRRMEVGLIGSCTNSSYQPEPGSLSGTSGKGESPQDGFSPDNQSRIGTNLLHCPARRHDKCLRSRRRNHYDQCLRPVHRTMETGDR